MSAGASMQRDREREDVAPAPLPAARERAIATIQARDLLGPSGLVRIEHEGEIYTLRLTRNNRLILTK